MKALQISDQLRQSILFQNASESVIKKVAEIASLKSIKAQEMLIKKGDVGSSMYIISNGRVRVHDGPLLLNILKKGQAFGEMAALDSELRTADITAEIDTDLIELEGTALFELLSNDSETTKAMIHFLCQREKTIINDVTERSLKLSVMEREMEIGRNIQSGFLPKDLPEVPGLEIAAYFEAAREVAGDFYDCFEIRNQNKIALVIGDVCGKGVGAALFMTLFRSLLRATLISEDLVNLTGNNKGTSDQFDPIKTLQNSVSLTNNYIAKTHEDACMFATLFVAIIDSRAGVIHYINAGHEALPIINNTGVKRLFSATGSAAGLFPDAEFTVEEAILEKGDLLLGFTDGVTEAVNKDKKQFSLKRLMDIAIENNETAQSSLDNIMKNLSEFTQEVDQFDDITLVAIKRS